jgi:hypothetical protein
VRRTTSKVIINFLALVIAGYFLFTSASEIFAQEFIGYSAAGIDANSIKPVVDAFRNPIGSPYQRRREIDWDGGGNNSTTSPAPTPFTGFQLIRGALFTTPGTGFVQALPSGLATTFNNAIYSTLFTTFSPLRLFSAVGSNVTDVHFFRPGTEIPATVNASAQCSLMSIYRQRLRRILRARSRVARESFRPTDK